MEMYDRCCVYCNWSYPCCGKWDSAKHREYTLSNIHVGLGFLFGSCLWGL